jgi:hypothetical protein
MSGRMAELLQQVRCPVCKSEAVQYVEGCLRCANSAEKFTPVFGGVRSSTKGMIPGDWKKEFCSLSATDTWHRKKRGKQ